MKTFFFGCMLAASGVALTLVDQNDDDLMSFTQSDLDLDLHFEDEGDDLSFLAQAGGNKKKYRDSGTQWYNDSGLVKTTFAIPEKNCCVFYSEKNFKGHRTEPLCYDKKTKNPITRRIPR